MKGIYVMKSRPTIKDIAAAVGVSHTTVSYIMSGNTTQKISEETRQAVLKAARELHYVPNGAARTLRNNSSNCISVALENSITSTRFSGLLQGIRDGLSIAGYRLMLFDFSCKGALYPCYLDSVLQRQTDGILYLSSAGNGPEDEWSELILSNDLPFVACDCCPDHPSLASVSFDYERGAFEVGCRLFGEGARRILYWRPNVQTQQEDYREEGLRRAAALYSGVELEISLLPYDAVETSAFHERYASFNRTCRQYLMQEIIPRTASFTPKDAIVCSRGTMVKHLCAMLAENPKHLKIAALSDSDVVASENTKILISRPSFLKGGQEAAKLLLQMIRGENPEKRIVIAPELPSYLEF